MMNSFHYLVFFCVAFSSAKPFKEFNVDSTHEELLDSTTYDIQALKWIRPFVKPLHGAVSAVDNVTREIFIVSGEPFRDENPAKNMFEKYFNGCQLTSFNFTGNGFTTFKQSKQSFARYSLEIAPLEPGTYQFEYQGFKKGKAIGRAWTVHSLRPYPIRSNAFFEFVHNLTRYEVTETTEISDSKLVGIERRQQPKSLLVYGLAEGFEDGTILDIQIRSRTELRESSTKVWLRLQEPESRESHRGQQSHPSKRDQIQVWVRDFEGTISNKQNLAQCVASHYGTSHLELEEVHFGDGAPITSFNAQIPNRDTCNSLGLIAQRILDCPFKVMAYNLTCASGESRFGPKNFFTTTADQESSKRLDSENLELPSESIGHLTTLTDVPESEFTEFFDVVKTSTRGPSAVSTSSLAASSAARSFSFEGPDHFDITYRCQRISP